MVEQFLHVLDDLKILLDPSIYIISQCTQEQAC